MGAQISEQGMTFAPKSVDGKHNEIPAVQELAYVKMWRGLACIGAIHTEFESNKEKTDEWHYYISSNPLKAVELFRHACIGLWDCEVIGYVTSGCINGIYHILRDFCRLYVEEETKKNLYSIFTLAKASVEMVS